MSLNLTLAQPDDEPFLFEVYASTRAYEMSFVPWSETQKQVFLKMQFAAQQKHYQSFYQNTRHQIIRVDNQPVGRIYVAYLEDEICLLDIAILPQHRGKGIGTELIRSVMEEGRKSGKPVRVYVENFNPSQNLFISLGFSKVSEDGVNNLFAWHSEAAANAGVKFANPTA
jgi:ribosomal protein S18 acetylase RimI-like enzyme